jgi:hypothetical protein
MEPTGLSSVLRYVPLTFPNPVGRRISGWRPARDMRSNSSQYPSIRHNISIFIYGVTLVPRRMSIPHDILSGTMIAPWKDPSTTTNYSVSVFFVRSFEVSPWLSAVLIRRATIGPPLQPVHAGTYLYSSSSLGGAQQQRRL